MIKATILTDRCNMVEPLPQIKNKDQKINELKLEESRLLEEAYKFRQLILKTQLFPADLEKIDTDLLFIFAQISFAYADKRKQVKDLHSTLGNI